MDDTARYIGISIVLAVCPVACNSVNLDLTSVISFDPFSAAGTY